MTKKNEVNLYGKPVLVNATNRHPCNYVLKLLTGLTQVQKRHGEVNHLLPLKVDGQIGHCHRCTLKHKHSIIIVKLTFKKVL